MHVPTDMLNLSQGDRTGFTLFGSALVHVILIMGIGFTFATGRDTPAETESIATATVTAESADETPDTDVFAAVDQEGGGLSNTPGAVTSPLPAISAEATRIQTRQRDTGASQRDEEPLQFVYVEVPSQRLADLAPADTEVTRDAAEQPLETTVDSPLAGELEQQLQLGLEVPRQKYISSRTHEHRYASYMESWRARVEQVGNLNYPEEARSRRLSGDLVLNVSIDADGTLADVRVVRSSGQKVLDDAAIRIVRMAAPFDAFPEAIREEADRIHITRTWQFLHNSTLIRN